jgi:molecular chaperone DnaJ
MDKKDYYEILGIDKNASAKEIKKAYRTLAKQYHPDHNNDSDAEQKFKEVSEAYEVLSDETKRKAYDQYGHAGTQGFGAGANGGYGYGSDPFDMGDISDIFNSMFGGGFGFGGGFQTSRQNDNSGSNLRYKIRLDFMESMKGGEYKLKINKDTPCKECEGSGSKNGEKKTCTTCGGQGRVQRIQNSFLGQMSVITECPDCHGEGSVITDPCPVCGGDGLIQEKKSIKINVPAGAYDGMVLRYRGSGNAGQRGGASGDLYVEISVDPHEIFERRGSDIYTDIFIDPAVAVLGDTVEVETIDGPVPLKIPSSTQPDTVFKISRKGVPQINGEGRGDQYVRVKIKIPTSVSRKEKQLWKDLRDN